MRAALDGLALKINVSVCSTVTGQKMDWNVEHSKLCCDERDRCEIMKVDINIDDSEGPKNCDLKGSSNPCEQHFLN